MEYEYDLLVFIGRFQPFHLGHKSVIETALKKSKRVLVLLGSAGSPRTTRNPFTFPERSKLIHDSFLEHDLDRAYDFEDVPCTSRIICKPLYDKTYNDTAWLKQVQSVVHGTALKLYDPYGLNGLSSIKIGLIGAAKDHTSYYLKLFPQWGNVDVGLANILHATSVREHFLEGKFEPWFLQDSILPKTTIDFLQQFIESPDYAQLCSEYEHTQNYKKAWEAAPYPVKHVTVDAVVEQSGHILLVRRRSEPGKGLWALPGGHLNEYERLEDGMIRELREETKIKVPGPVLRGSIEQVRTFDDPYRSNIGRVITQAFHIKLADQTELPKVKGSDDAEKARWVPISEVFEDQMFDDHYHIIQYFVGV